MGTFFLLAHSNDRQLRGKVLTNYCRSAETMT